MQGGEGLYILDSETELNPIPKTVNPVFMKRRVRKIANFFAFNLLFFALYLNFIHKDSVAVPATPQNTAAFSGTVLVDNSAYADKKADATELVAH